MKGVSPSGTVVVSVLSGEERDPLRWMCTFGWPVVAAPRPRFDLLSLLPGAVGKM